MSVLACRFLVFTGRCKRYNDYNRILVHYNASIKAQHSLRSYKLCSIPRVGRALPRRANIYDIGIEFFTKSNISPYSLGPASQPGQNSPQP